MRLRHLIILFSLLILWFHLEMPIGQMDDCPGIGHIGLVYARGGDGGGDSGGDGGHGGGHGGDSGSGGGSGDGGHGGNSGSVGGSGDGGHGGNSGSGGNAGDGGHDGGGSSGGSGDGGHGGGSSGGDSGDGGQGGDGGSDGDGDGGHDGDSPDTSHDSSHDISHDTSHDTDHDDATHDSAHATQDHHIMVEHPMDDHVDDHQNTVNPPHHDENPTAVPPPPTVADQAITDKSATTEGGLFEPGVLLAVNAEPSDLEAAWAMGLAVEQEIVLPSLGITVTRFQVARGDNARNSLRKLIHRKSGAHYDLNHYYRTAGTSQGNDIRSYPRRQIGWPDPSGIHGSPVRIGMVDTRVDPGMTALRRQQIITHSFASPKTPAFVHGTSIAAIFVGAQGSRFPGLIPSATLYAANAFGNGRNGRPMASALAIARSLDWLVANHVDVINLSLTGPDNRLVQLAVARTVRRPIPIVAAAGNQGPAAAPAYPAAYPKVIAVTAVDRFSRIWRHANQGRYIDFAAPGVGIWVPDRTGQGCFRQGTSYAAAYATALAAVFRSPAPPDTAIDALIHRFCRSVVDLGAPGRDPCFGWGLIHFTPATR